MSQPTADMSPERRAALVKLLADDDPRISSVVWDHLERLGEGVLPDVEQASRESDDPRVRAQARRYLTEWARREVFREWVTYCREGGASLEAGVFLVARSEYPHADIKACRAVLDEYGELLRKRVRTARTTADAVAKISHFLFEENGFRGNEDNYNHPDNSYLNRVLELRRGIPISLAVLYLLVCDRVSVRVSGVGLPGHFVLKYREQRSETFVDVFRGGRLRTARDCAAYVVRAGLEFRASYLEEVTSRDILRRMLGNLLKFYVESHDRRRSTRVAAMLKLLS